MRERKEKVLNLVKFQTAAAKKEKKVSPLHSLMQVYQLYVRRCVHWVPNGDDLGWRRRIPERGRREANKYSADLGWSQVGPQPRLRPRRTKRSCMRSLAQNPLLRHPDAAPCYFSEYVQYFEVGPAVAGLRKIRPHEWRK